MNLPEIFNGSEVFPSGVILATANLTDCIKITPKYISTLSEDEIALGDYTAGRYAWVLEDIKKLPCPIPAKGRGFGTGRKYISLKFDRDAGGEK